MEPIKKFSEDDSEDYGIVGGNRDKTRTNHDKYQTTRLTEERDEKETKSKTGNASTEDKDWS